jgi:hypothetical protein
MTKKPKPCVLKGSTEMTRGRRRDSRVSTATRAARLVPDEHRARP